MKVRKQNICTIFNLAPNYRAAIYSLIDDVFDIDFYIGDRVGYEIALMDYKSLNGFKGILKYVPLVGNWHWQHGAVRLAFRKYDHYLMDGDLRCLSNWMVLIFAKFLGKRTHIWTHGVYGDESVLKKKVKRIFFGLSTHVLLYGNYARTLMIKEGYSPDKLAVIYNSLNYNMQKKIRRELSETTRFINHFGSNNPVLIFIGRIQKVKKLDLLIKALFELNKIDHIYNIVIIGKEVEPTGIHDLVEKYGLREHVWFYGQSYDEHDIAELIYNSNVCVSPGNVGLSALHSLVYGTPVITHDNFCNQMPEFESIEDGFTGMFFKEDSVQDLMDKIIEMVELTHRDRIQIRTNCYKVIREKFNPEYQIEILKGILN